MCLVFMKKFLIKNQRAIVLTSSIFGVLAWLALTIQSIIIGINISPTTGDLIYEFSSILFTLPLLLPGLIGLRWFSGKSSKTSLMISIPMIAYFLFNLLCYGVYIQATDALEAGLLFVIIGIPVSVTATVIMLVKALEKN